MGDVHAGHAPGGLLDPTDSWGTLGVHVVAAKGARGARVARSLSVRSISHHNGAAMLARRSPIGDVEAPRARFQRLENVTTTAVTAATVATAAIASATLTTATLTATLSCAAVAPAVASATLTATFTAS